MQHPSLRKRAVAGVLLIAAAWLWPAAETRDTSVLPRIFAVVAPGPNADGLDAAGLLDPLLAARELAWVGAEALIIPGASGRGLERRLHSGRIVSRAQSPDLLAEAGFEIIGRWGSESATPEVDVARFAQRLKEPGASPGCVLYLGCALGTPECTVAATTAIAAILTAAERGGVGILLSVPPAGAPARGAIWVGGDDIDPQAPLRFRLIDFAPMLLHLAGHALPTDIDGTPALEVLRKDVRFRRPPRFVGGQP